MSSFPNSLLAADDAPKPHKYEHSLLPAAPAVEVGEYTAIDPSGRRLSPEVEIIARFLAPQPQRASAESKESPGQLDADTAALTANVGRGLAEFFTPDRRAQFQGMAAADRHEVFRTLPRELQTGIFDLVERFDLRRDPLRALALAESLRAAPSNVTAKLERQIEKAKTEGIDLLGVRALRTQPLQAGVSEEIAETLGGPVIGPLRVAAGLTRPFSEESERSFPRKAASGAAEVVRGALQTVAPALAATRPAFLAALPAFEAAGAATELATEPLPIAEEYKDLARAVVPLVAGGAVLRTAPGRPARRQRVPLTRPRVPLTRPRGTVPQTEVPLEPAATAEAAPASARTSPTAAPASARPKVSNVFSRALDHADRFVVEKVGKPIAAAIERALPESVKKLGRHRIFRSQFSRFPAVRRAFEEARLEVAAVRNEGEALTRMLQRTKPTPEETLAFDHIVRGEPADLAPARLRPAQQAVADQVHVAAQKVTAERQALGLNVREEWLAGPKHWYPNFFRQHLGQWVAGKLFGRTKMTPGKQAMGSLKQRLSDRFWFLDRSGKAVESSEGAVAAFKTRAAAEAFQSGKGGKGWKVVEPMTREQLLAHGLITDPALNLRTGFALQGALLGKTRFLARIGEMPGMVSATREPGYVALSEVRFEIPKALADKNPAIAKLRDGYVLEGVARELGALYGARGVFANAFRIAEGSLRKWATVRNPFRHPRQIVENELTLAMTDMPAFLDKPAQALAFRNYARGAGGEPNVPYWKEFINSRIGHTDLVTGEFETMWRGLARQALEPNAPLSLTERMAIWAESNPAARKLMMADAFAHKMYRAEDSAYKFYRYKRLRERGMEHESAVQNVKDRAFDYFDVPPIVRGLNRVIPFVPNVAFQFGRIFTNLLRDEPVSAMTRIGLLAGGYYMLREQMLERSGLTERDLARMDKAMRPGLHEVVLPWTDDEGRNLSVNLRWLIPYSDVSLIFAPFEAESPEQAIAEASRRVIPMVAQPVATVLSQRTPWGRKVLTGAETRKDALKKLGYAATVESLPVLLGQYWAALKRNAEAGERSKRGLAERGLVLPLVGGVRRFHREEQENIGQAKQAGRLRAVDEQLGVLRGRLIRGQISGAAFAREVEALQRTVKEAANPEVLAVAEAVERGDREATRRGLANLRSVFRSEEAAEDAVVQVLDTRRRLEEELQSPLTEARSAADAIVASVRNTGQVTEAQYSAFEELLDALPKRDEEKLVEWLGEQIEIARRVHRERNVRLPLVTPRDDRLETRP